jgi:hypothetical protein
MTKVPLNRITCTLRSDLVRTADALAAKLGRSRSWVIAEALRAYLTTQDEARSAPRVREPEPNAYAAEFEAARLDRLRSDLALTPEQRVRVAEELAATAPDDRRRVGVRFVAQFDSWEDYFEWKRRVGSLR